MANATAHLGAPIWVPDPQTARSSTLAKFAEFVMTHHPGVIDDPLDYRSLWKWSTDDIGGFWESVWQFFGVVSTTPYEHVIGDEEMPGARWFPGARVNYAEHALRLGHPDSPALICVTEDGREEVVSWARLRRDVAALAATLRRLRLSPGDRVVGYLPPGRHAVTGLLAAASIGAVWSQCAQDLGASAVIDRLGQLEPAVLIAGDGYSYNGRHHDRRPEVRAVRAGLPTLTSTILVGHPTQLVVAGVPDTTLMSWDEAVSAEAELEFAEVPFEHPLWVLFSSGTTGLPKGIVHNHGGITLGLLSLLGLHMDLRQGDRLLWYTSTNWVMWNILASSLLTGATAVIYDGSPTYPDPRALWRIASDQRVTFLGTSPGYLQACARAGIDPGTEFDLGPVRTVGSTGSVLPSSSYRWVRDNVGRGVQLCSLTGGTDVVTAFASSAPTTPVWAGEISAPCLGVALQAWDPAGMPVRDQVGELVITKPMPSMPVSFWNDPTGDRYRQAYFSMYPTVWRHGDWVVVTGRGSVVMQGRSDSTLNRNGIRIGTAEIYRVVENLPQVQDSLIVGVEETEGSYWMPLFVVVRPEESLDDELRATIKTAIRSWASPRHVPDEIIAVASIPRTRSGKKLEVPIKRILQGANPADVLSAGSIENPRTIDQFVALGQSRRLGGIAGLPAPARSEERRHPQHQQLTTGGPQ